MTTINRVESCPELEPVLFSLICLEDVFPVRLEVRLPTGRPVTHKGRLDQLAYGCWLTDPGREVMFNRGYQPIWQRQGGVVSMGDPEEWVEDIFATRFYYHTNDTEEAKQRKAYAAMIDFGIPFDFAGHAYSPSDQEG